jgi:acetylornithine deacetylase/succinyl-diaminopimelate desuccinylase-like protein
VSEFRSLDGYCGYRLREGEEMLMIMAHIDVVPAGPA